jgi:flavin-dependent dehydrogenase
LINTNKYDVAITGGGLAGLSLSIQLAKAGYSVAVFEKEKYPFHKVCGEYISLENWNFLEELGLPLSDWNLPIIKRLMISAPNGNFIEHDLPLGGFGISRYKIDAALAAIARSAGVIIYEETKVTDIIFEKSVFNIHSQANQYQAKIMCGTFGKRSNLDVKWKRWFTRQKNNKLNNYIGVKYHIQTEFAADLIALHNFENGYCGISKIEENKYCLCYLTTAENLQRSGNSIKKMEQEILQQNPFLSGIFSSATILYEQPLTISQISFAKKSQVHDHVLLIGDAAGMVTPLCGNGMSMALHGSKIAFEYIRLFLQDQLKRYEMEQQYTDSWNRHFSKRLLAGRIIQRFFGNAFLSNFLLKFVKPFPKFVSYLIRQTHGEPY